MVGSKSSNVKETRKRLFAQKRHQITGSIGRNGKRIMAAVNDPKQQKKPTG